MCAFVDANAVHEVFGSNQEPATEAGKGFFRWRSRDKGKLVVGGKLKEQLDQGVPKFRIWALQATLLGKLIDADKSCVDQETEKVRNGDNLQSDDEHIIALAQVSRARLLFSSGDLQRYFGKPAIINTSHGKIYFIVKNKSFIESKRIILGRHRFFSDLNRS